jgi:zinc protease
MFRPPHALADSASLPPLPAETVVLSNGLRVMLAPDPHATLTSVRASYNVGAADDPNGLRGLAHLSEHMVAAQTKHLQGALHLLAASGASHFNATTSLDSTFYFETVPPERLETALWVESERMGYAAEVVTEARVVAERPVVHNEELERRTDGLLGAVWAFPQHELFPGWHPYSTVSDGDFDFDSIHATDVQAFLSTWYTPRNAVLAIAGRFDRESTLALVRRYFESLPSPQPPVRPTLRTWTTEGARLVVAASALRDQVVVEWRTPSFGAQDDAALDFASMMLSGPGNTRLRRALVDTNLASSVSTREASHRAASVFWVSATCAPGKQSDVVLRAIQDTVDALATSVTNEDVARARAAWWASTLSKLARRLRRRAARRYLDVDLGRVREREGAGRRASGARTHRGPSRGRRDRRGDRDGT